MDWLSSKNANVSRVPHLPTIRIESAGSVELQAAFFILLPPGVEILIADAAAAPHTKLPVMNDTSP